MQPPQHLSSNSNSQSNPGLERPATTFLSYAREDAEEVIYLQHQLNVRGVRAWRDVTDILSGGYIASMRLSVPSKRNQQR